MRKGPWLARLLAFSLALLVSATHAQTAPTFTREQRLSRFNQFLAERKQALYDLGARAQSWGVVPGTYAYARLLDPRDVVDPLAYAINRYDSYQARLQSQATSEDLVLRPVVFGAMRPAGYVSPEDYPGLDESDQIQLAVNTASVWLTPGRTYVLRKVLTIPSGREIVSDGSATIVIATGDGTAFPADSRNSHDGLPLFGNQPIQINHASNVVLRDFRIRMAADPSNVQPLLRGGLQITNSSNVRIQGLELLGFPRVLGVLRVNSSSGVVLQDNLIHGGYTRIPTRQVTGIEVDNDRYNELYSSNLRIVGNFVLGVMVDNGVVFSTGYSDRSGVLGYETDGINVQTNVAPLANPAPVLVADNSIMDVGEGIDTFDSNGTYRNNYIERAFAVGIKLVHGASRNVLIGNRITATGFSSIQVSSPTAGKPSASNTFVRNRIRFTNAFQTESLPSGVPRPARIGAIELSGYAERNEFFLDSASEPVFQYSPYLSGVYCGASATAGPNLLWKEGLAGFSVPYNLQTAGCAQLKTSAPVLQSIAYAEWTRDGVSLESNVRYDHWIEQPSTDRLWANVPGNHEVRVHLTNPSWTGRHFLMSTLVRRGTNTRIMMRDQVTDWYAIYDLTGEGRLLSREGSMITGGGILRITDDWYFITTRFIASRGGDFLITLRQLDSGSGAFLDLGETRLDPDE